MGIFGNFVHGTHVAGITVKNNDSKILSVKLIPTEVKLPFSHSTLSQVEVGPMQEKEGLRWRLLRTGLSTLAEQQMLLLEEIATYVNGHKADIANGSFGTGFAQAKMITDNLYRVIFF